MSLSWFESMKHNLHDSNFYAEVSLRSSLFDTILLLCFAYALYVLVKNYLEYRVGGILTHS